MFQINFGQRSPEKLEGQWGLLPDPMERCRQQGWWKSQRKHGFFFPSYDDDAFWPTQVPGAYNIIHPNLEYYEGDVIYLLHFPAQPARKGERVYLAFEGVAERCQIYLNGNLVAEHDGPYTPFPVEVTNHLKEQNRLLMIVTCKRLPETVPGTIHDWFRYGGIHSPVHLYRVPEVFIQDVGLQTTLHGDTVRLGLDVRLYGPTRDQNHPVHAWLEDATGEKVVSWEIHEPAKTWVHKDAMIPRADIKLWAPGHAHLYRLVVECGPDRWEDEVGLRQVTTQGTRLMLNGEDVFLRGVCTWIHDPASGIISTRKETADKLIEIGRDLKINFLRTGHTPPSREYIRACDRAGILCWSEIPAYWMGLHMVEPAAMHRALSMAREMLCAFRNSPSIIIWSVGNECCIHDTELPRTNLAYFLTMAEFFHTNDPTRLVTYTGGMEGSLSPHVKKICPQELVDQLDVVGINTYSGIHDGAEKGAREEVGDLALCIETTHAFGKPMILAENGIDAVLGETDFDFGEERQESYYKKVWAIIDKCRREGKIQGVSYWTLADFRSPIKFSRHQRGYNRKGIVTVDFKPKKAFHVVAKAFSEVAKETSS
jgi:beta-glucuronidase